MKCKKFGCDNEAGRYPCCSQNHGYMYNLERQQIKDSFEANSQKGLSEVRSLYSVEHAIYYNVT